MAVHLSYVLNVRQTAMQVKAISDSFKKKFLMLQSWPPYSSLFHTTHAPFQSSFRCFSSGGLLHVDQHFSHQHRAASVVAPLWLLPLH